MDPVPSLPLDIWKLIWDFAQGAPIRFVCQRWKEHCKYKKISVITASIPLLRWIKVQGGPMGISTCAFVAADGKLETLQWLYGKTSDDPRSALSILTVIEAVKKGHLSIVKWISLTASVVNYISCGASTIPICHAAQSGNLELVRWMRAYGFEWDSSACASAAEKGHLEVLKWLRNPDFTSGENCPWDTWTCAYAARSGHLEVLKWARANGCPWNDWTGTYATVYACESGDLSVLKWVFENRFVGWGECPYDKDECLKRAKDHPVVLQWILTYS